MHQPAADDRSPHGEVAPAGRPRRAAPDTTAPRPTPAPRLTARPHPGARRTIPRWSVPCVAAVVAVAVRLAAEPLGVDVVARAGGVLRPVTPADVTVAAVVVALLGWAVRTLLARARRGSPDGGERVWLVLCAVTVLVSLLGPLGGVGAGAVAVLLAEHVAVGAVVALGLRR